MSLAAVTVIGSWGDNVCVVSASSLSCSFM